MLIVFRFRRRTGSDEDMSGHDVNPQKSHPGTLALCFYV